MTVKQNLDHWNLRNPINDVVSAFYYAIFDLFITQTNLIKEGEPDNLEAFPEPLQKAIRGRIRTEIQKILREKFTRTTLDSLKTDMPQWVTGIARHLRQEAFQKELQALMLTHSAGIAQHFKVLKQQEATLREREARLLEAEALLEQRLAAIGTTPAGYAAKRPSSTRLTVRVRQSAKVADTAGPPPQPGYYTVGCPKRPGVQQQTQVAYWTGLSWRNNDNAGSAELPFTPTFWIVNNPH